MSGDAHYNGQSVTTGTIGFRKY